MNDDAIYVLTARDMPEDAPRLPDVTVLKNESGYWSIGSDRNGFSRWVDAYGKPMQVDRALNGMGITFMSHVVYLKNNGRWQCVKNRFGPCGGEPPFTSLEEARLRSAVKGWPDPALLMAV